MPIVRTYACPDCGHFLEVTLAMADWDAPPPECPRCAVQTRQEFTPVAIGGSHRARAVKIAEEIAAKDYNVADMNVEGYEGVRNKVRYKDQTSRNAGNWGAGGAALQNALALGRKTRLEHGSGLDVIKTMPDLIQESKKRSARIW